MSSEITGITPVEAGFTPESREQKKKLNPLQELAVEANYARSFFQMTNIRIKHDLPWLIPEEQKERAKFADPLEPSKRDIRTKYMFGVYDAYIAKQHGQEGTDKFRKGDWADKADYLLGIVDSIQPVLDKKKEEAIANPDKIQPYDVHLAKRRARKLRTALPKELKRIFTEASQVEPELMRKKVAEFAGNISATAASYAAVDAAAASVGFPVEAAHFPLVENVPMGVTLGEWLVSYIPLGAAIWTAVKANRRLNDETGLSTNAGFTAGELLATATLADEKTAKMMDASGQYGLELSKEIPWAMLLIGLVATNKMTLQEAFITSMFANVGAIAYEYGVAGLVHKGLNARRKFFNSRHPFPEVTEEEGVLAQTEITSEVTDNHRVIPHHNAAAKPNLMNVVTEPIPTTALEGGQIHE